MLKSTSGTEPPPPLHTRDATPVKSKVALRLTASQGVDYCSTARTVYLSHHREGHRCCTGHRMTVDTLYVIITTQVPLHIFFCEFSTTKNFIMQQQITRKHFVKHRQTSKHITDISMLYKEVKNPEGTFHFLRHHTHNSEDKSDYVQPKGQCRVKWNTSLADLRGQNSTNA